MNVFSILLPGRIIHRSPHWEQAINPVYKPHNASDKLSHNAPFCNRNVQISVTDWCIVAYGTGLGFVQWVYSMHSKLGDFLSFERKETVKETTHWLVKLYGWCPMRLRHLLCDFFQCIYFYGQIRWLYELLLKHNKDNIKYLTKSRDNIGYPS